MSKREKRQERKKRYHRVLRVVAYHSGVKKPVMAASSLRRICVDQIGMDTTFYENHLRAAIDNGDLVRGSGWVWSPERADATEAIEWVISEADDPQEFVAHMNQHTQ